MGEKRQQREKKKPQTKVIIRQLPPTMTEEEFLKQIDPLPEHDDYYFVLADWSLGYEATCRAYINFTNPDDVFLFQERFDGYVFVDAKGTEYPAQVEYAPFQGFSKSRSKKKDIKASSIESDVHYLEFVERFNNQENDIVKGDLKVDFNLNSKSTDTKLTPLLEYLHEKKDARREERKRRNDERRDRRDKDRQQKKVLVAKNIPAAIKEEGTGSSEQKADSKEGTSKNSQEDKPKEGNCRRDRYEEKRIQRKREKDAKRRERRDQKRAEERRGSKESIEGAIAKKVEDMSLNEVTAGDNNEEETNELKDEIKKPVEQTEKNADKKDDVTRRSERRERDRKEERERRVRNKDRPDMQIYQPGKLRTTPSSPNTEEGCSSGAAPTGGKKRVSRYSEKRRAKESSIAGPTTAPKEEPENPSDNM